MKKVIIPISSYGFDPTETAIPWKILSENGVKVKFATPDGKKGLCDMLMLTGNNLGPLKKLLAARIDAVTAYKKMNTSAEFCNPSRYDEIEPDNYDGIFLPGGHHKGVRVYLESEYLQNTVSSFFEADKIVGAICHGVLLAAKSTNKKNGKSVLYHVKTTALLKKQERLAYYLTKYILGEYYLTYPETTVEDEVKKALKTPENFVYGSLPLRRDKPTQLKYGFSLRHNNYISARWPGDIYSITFGFLNMIKNIN